MNYSQIQQLFGTPLSEVEKVISRRYWGVFAISLMVAVYIGYHLGKRGVGAPVKRP